MNASDLPRGAGTAIFPGGGAWLPRRAPSEAGYAATDRLGSTAGDHPSDAAVLLSNPERILVANRPDELPSFLDQIEAEQARGRYLAGYLAYEAGAAFHLTVRDSPAQPLPPAVVACDSVPLAWMAVYPPESVTLVPAKEWAGFLDAFDVGPIAARVAGIRPELNVSKAQYTAAIATVRDYIAAGDTYQVNYTVRARYDLGSAGAGSGAAAERLPGGAGAADVGGAAAGPGAPLDPLDYFLALVVRQAVPYAAYLDLGHTQVLSLSPELFLRRDGERLESRPMKGTRPRDGVHSVDVDLAYELAETEKERAENLMIVDMVRNDLGHVCHTGTIHVPTLFAVEPYRTVWQMTSTVQGLLQAGTSLTQIMQAVYPGASITGAPKHHTMEIIAGVESEPRGVYTGTVALFTPGGDFTGNIGIRTITHRGGHCTFGVGSGVVWDATAPAEYEETLAKGAFAVAPSSGEWRPSRAGAPKAGAAKAGASRSGTATGRAPRADAAGAAEALELRLLETILLGADNRYSHLEAHLNRLAASAEVLGFPFDVAAACAALTALAGSACEPLVVRVDLDRGGKLGLSTREAPAAATAPVSLLVSPFRIDEDDPLLAHKTTHRGFYDRERRRAAAEGCFDALFLNRLDRVTEGGITNVFARFGDTWTTPPLADGLLPGIWRAAFAVEKAAVERSLTLDELLQADEIVVGNSVRGAVAVAELLADPLSY